MSFITFTIVGLGLNFLLASASFTHSHTLSLGSYCRPTAGKSSSPAGLSTLVCAYVVDCAPASPYAYSSSTHRFPDESTPIQATPLLATSAELGLGLGLGLGLDSLAHFSSHALPSSLQPPFTHYSFSPRSLVCGGQTNPHKPRLVVSHSTCSPRSSHPHAHSFVLGTAVINNNKSTLPREQLSNRYCSNKHTHYNSFIKGTAFSNKHTHIHTLYKTSSLNNNKKVLTLIIGHRVH